MNKAFAAIGFVVFAAPAMAQMTPEGLWRNIDDKTGEAKAEIRIKDNGAGALHGVLEKRLAKDAKPEDVQGMQATSARTSRCWAWRSSATPRKAEGRDVWEDGKILDPENGRNYTLRMTPIEGGKKLQVRGSFGPFGRTQTWIRVQ
jgi:hypothetical protein